MTIYGHKIEKMFIFLYNLYVFVCIQHGYLPNMVLALDSSKSAVKKLWCIGRAQFWAL